MTKVLEFINPLIFGSPSLQPRIMMDKNKIKQVLLKFGRQIDPKELFPAYSKEAIELALSDPYAFCLATCLDREARTQSIWSIPYDIYKKIGHLDPYRINQMSKKNWTSCSGACRENPDIFMTQRVQ